MAGSSGGAMRLPSRLVLCVPSTASSATPLIAASVFDFPQPTADSAPLCSRLHLTPTGAFVPSAIPSLPATALHTAMSDVALPFGVANAWPYFEVTISAAPTDAVVCVGLADAKSVNAQPQRK